MTGWGEEEEEEEEEEEGRRKGHDPGSCASVLSDSPVLGHISEGEMGGMGEQCHKISKDKSSSPLCKVLKVNFWRQMVLS